MSPTVLIQVDESAVRLNIASWRGKDPEEAQAALDSASSYLPKLSLSLKTHWNNLVIPVSVLPEELLARILTEAVKENFGTTTEARTTEESWKRRVQSQQFAKRGETSP